MSWATSNPNDRYQFALVQHPQPRRLKHVPALTAVAIVSLPVALALYYLLPPSPVVAVLVGLLLSAGASIPISILLAVLTEPKPQTIIDLMEAPGTDVLTIEAIE